MSLFNKIIYSVVLIIVVFLIYYVINNYLKYRKLVGAYNNLQVSYSDKEKEIADLSSRLDKALKDINKEREITTYWIRKYKSKSGEVVEVVKEVPAECKVCFENYSKPVTVENDLWRFSDDNCLDDVPGNLELKNDFRKKIIDTYLETMEAEENKLVSLRGSISADLDIYLHEGLGFGLEILNLKKIFRIPVGIGVQFIVDFNDFKDSRIGGNLHYRILKNLGLGVSAGSTVLSRGYVGGQMEVYLW